MAQQIVEFKKTLDGNLRIELLPEAREDLEEIQANDSQGSFFKFLDVIEFQRCNGWEEIRPEEIAALTSALIITDDCTRSDDTDELLTVGRVYWNPNYMVEDEVQLLLDRGYVEFEGVD